MDDPYGLSPHQRALLAALHSFAAEGKEISLGRVLLVRLLGAALVASPFLSAAYVFHDDYGTSASLIGWMTFGLLALNVSGFWPLLAIIGPRFTNSCTLNTISHSKIMITASLVGFGFVFAAFWHALTEGRVWLPVGVELSPGMAGLVAVDNLCHGIFFDTFELYGVQIGTKFRHTTLSATVFQLTRLALGAFVVGVVFGAYKLYRVRAYCRAMPSERASVAAFAAGIIVPGKLKHLPRSLADFLLLAAAHLDGDYARVRWLATRLPAVELPTKWYDCFRDKAGVALLPAAWERKVPVNKRRTRR